MAEKIIPVNNLIEFGVIKDMPTVGLAPNTFTDTRNIRLRDGAVWKMKGDTALANSLNPTMPTNYSAGDFVRVLGYCVDSGNTNGSASIYFNPDNTWVEIS